MNAHLPPDIRIVAVKRCSQDFHARFHATGKQYRYFVWNHPAMNPLFRHTAWHVPRPLDLAAMRRAAPAVRRQTRLSNPSPPIPAIARWNPRCARLRAAKSSAAGRS